MAYRVRVRINVRTGEFELFQVEDLDPVAEPAEHNDRHEEVSETVGRFVARRPDVEEVQSAEPGPIQDGEPLLDLLEEDGTTLPSDPSDRRVQES